MNWYLVLRHDPQPTTADDTMLEQHLNWMRAQHDRGTVVISGPTADRSMGMYLLRAHSRADAARVAAEDPLAAQRQARIDIIEWEIHQILGAGPWTALNPRLRGR